MRVALLQPRTRHHNLLEEIINFILCYLLVIVAINSAEGSVWLKIMNGAEKLALSFNLQLTLSDCPQKITQMILSLQSKHLSLFAFKKWL